MEPLGGSGRQASGRHPSHVVSGILQAQRFGRQVNPVGISDMDELRDTRIDTLAVREEYRDQYFLHRDPIYQDRLLWRAHTFRHIIHLLPNQSILELGCGRGLLTPHLCRVSRGENPVTSVTFRPEQARPDSLPAKVEFLHAPALPGPLRGKQYDFIVAMDLLDQRNCGWFLQHIYELLRPGGQVVFYESNPWNPRHQSRSARA